MIPPPKEQKRENSLGIMQAKKTLLLALMIKFLKSTLVLTSS